MEIISTKVEKEPKEKLKKLYYINWSEVARESLKARIEDFTSRPNWGGTSLLVD